MSRSGPGNAAPGSIEFPSGVGVTEEFNTPHRGYRIPQYNDDFEFNSPSLRFGSSQLGTSSQTPLLVGGDCWFTFLLAIVSF